MVHFTRPEIRHILISIFVLVVALSGIGPYWLGVEEIGIRIAAISLPLVAGFFLHEFAHKSIAMRFGYWAVYRMWTFGLLFALVIGLASSGRFLFAAPGAVVILTPYASRRESGLISVAGPLTNLAVGGCFLPLAFLGENLLGLIGSMGAWINFWLAFFNLLPMPPLDGSKIFYWNARVWIAAEALSIGLMAFSWRMVLPF